MELVTDLLLVALVTLMGLGWIVLLSLRSSDGPGLDKAEGVQKVHTKRTSRLGGLGILLGLACGLSLTNSWGPLNFSWIDSKINISSFKGLYAPLLVCAMPVFLGGLLEDLTHQISPKVRFVMGLVSASSAWIVLGLGVSRTGVWLIDQLLVFTLISYLVTMLVVVGFTHAMNIVDGFHGLAASQVLFMTFAMALLCEWDGQYELLTLNLVMFAVSIGFFVMNWPSGRSFLGDAGAYLMGFWVVSLGLLWVQSDVSISPMAPVLLGAYPLIETLWSIYRRLLSQKKSVASPDSLHLHSLVYRRLWWMASPIGSGVRNGSRQKEDLRNSRNALVAPCFCVVFLALDAFVICFYQDTYALLMVLVVFTIAYLWLFRRLVQFKTPALLVAISQSSKIRARAKSRDFKESSAIGELRK